MVLVDGSPGFARVVGDFAREVQVGGSPFLLSVRTSFGWSA